MILFIAALFATGLGTSLIALLAFFRRTNTCAIAVCVQMIALSWWTFCYAMQLLNSYYPQYTLRLFEDPLFWFKALFVGAVVVPAGLLVFMLQYTGSKQRIGPRFLLLLSVMPVLTLVMVATDSQHHLFLGGFQTGHNDTFVGGPAFWLHTLYSYAISLFAQLLLIRFIFTASPVYRRQAILLLIAAQMPLVANLVSIFHLLPEPLHRVDISSFGFLVSAIVMFYCIRHEGLLRLLPVARATIVERMEDGVLVTDARYRLTDFNRAADGMLTPISRLRAGINILDSFPFLNTRTGPVQAERMDVTLQAADNSDLHFSVQQTALTGWRGELKGHIYVFRDVSDLKRVEADLREQLKQNEVLRQTLKEESIRDPLTGLFNRRLMEEALDRELSRSARTDAGLCLCLIDIDYFKRVNDTFGHNVGDQVLKAFGEELLALTRDMDVACRYGGEEFLLILPMVPVSVAVARLETLRKAFSARSFGPDGPASVGFSAGIAINPEHGAERLVLLKKADQALYQAKAAGRNQTQIYIKD
ncbi:MAG: hypothetical protein CL581_13990 [Alteromonadaceae bacterium]|nr:hypothetical protein [Alteromonadaceae bacterium]MBH85451.1 hypothetical protein [Alteromonadaceae bacterium]